MSISHTLRIGFGALVIAASLISFTAESSAQVATAEQRAACTPDAFRLCASESDPATHRMRRTISGLQAVFARTSRT